MIEINNLIEGVISRTIPLTWEIFTWVTIITGIKMIGIGLIFGVIGGVVFNFIKSKINKGNVSPHESKIKELKEMKSTNAVLIYKLTLEVEGRNHDTNN